MSCWARDWNEAKRNKKAPRRALLENSRNAGPRRHNKDAFVRPMMNAVFRDLDPLDMNGRVQCGSPAGLDTGLDSDIFSAMFDAEQGNQEEAGSGLWTVR